MEILLAFAAGIAVAVLVRRVSAGRPPAPAADTAAASTPAAPEPSPAPPRTGLVRLQELATPLSAAGDASSHPRDLLNHDSFREAVAILGSADVPLAVVSDYATGANYMLSAAALAALATRPDRNEASPTVLRHFRHLAPWPVCYALQYFTKIHARPALGALVMHLPDYWASHALVPGLFADHFAARLALGDVVGLGDSVESASPAEMANAQTLLRAVPHDAAKTLAERLAAWQRGTLDRTYLETFGRFVVPDITLLLEHEAIRDQLGAAEAALLEFPRRSVLVAGDPRSGKTSFVMLLAARARARGWTLFEAGSGDLIAGQQYIGQIEERLHRLATDLAADKRVIWYAPDFLQLAASGTHKGQAASLLDQIFPAIASGRVLLVSETTSSALTTIVQQRPGLLGTLEVVRLRPLHDAEVDRLLEAFLARITDVTGMTMAADVHEACGHLARHYLGSERLPGAAIDLVKLAAERADARDAKTIDRADVLASMSKLTGLPAIVLDDRERVDLAALRRFFTDRVIGQDEAVDAVVDRVAMLKAGLTDPGKPIAVFLFAGPTGTGKTELAKTLAAFLFGSPDRLMRLDMSEFQSLESTRKILGVPDQPDPHALTQRVRSQPFSVVLLDEFEKAHANVWDLFLQVFDDGRLTDATGQTVDFRHTIIILTSNLGSTIPQGAGLGFGQAGSPFSQEHVLRAVHQSFRPEFVNRLDAVIVFRPLTRELMRSIITRELSRVLERRGLRQREWAVEWESSALDFLLDKGFSPAMGARPLKRAIDRYLLAPLAATLVEHRAPEGDQFLFVRSDGRAIQVEFVDPDRAPDPAEPLAAPAPSGGPTLPGMMLQPGGTAEERSRLIEERRRLEGRLAAETWVQAEAALLDEMQQPGFWSRDERFRTLARYALMDRVKAAIGTAAGLEARLERADRGGRYSRDLIARLASQLYVICHGIEDVFTDAPVEVVLAVQPSLEAGADQAATSQWSDRLREMYRKWAANRHMQWEEVAASGPGAVPLALVSGFGAARILERETGLHVLEYDRGDELARAAARVRVAPTPAVLPDSAAAKCAALATALNTSASASVKRRYRLEPSPLIRDVTHGWRTGRADLVLQGHFDLLADVLRPG